MALLRVAFLLAASAFALQERRNRHRHNDENLHNANVENERIQESYEPEFELGRRGAAIVEERDMNSNLERKDLFVEDNRDVRPRDMFRRKRAGSFMAEGTQSRSTQTAQVGGMPVPGAAGAASGGGFLGTPLSTWVLVAFCVGTGVLLCMIGIFFFKKHMVKVVSCIENSICTLLTWLFLKPAHLFCSTCRTMTYPVKEKMIGCCTSVNHYFNPYKVIT